VRPLRIVLSLSLVALLATPPAADAQRRRPARAAKRSQATRVALGLGADYLVDPEIGEMQLTLAIETPIVRGLTAGARFGALVTSDPTRVGAPIDFRLRLRSGRLYADGLVGPWLLFDSGDTLRFHAAFGFGILARSMSLGLEVGYLDPTSMIGLRMAFPL
jgi:hypothetical protein